MRNGAYRPSIREAVGILAVIVLIQVFNLFTHDDVLTAVVTIVICGAFIGRWIWVNRYH